MTENKNYCMGCMKEIDDNVTICPHCSYNALSSQTAPFLSKGSMVSDKYLVGKVEAFSTDSITYIGLDTETGSTVNIIEFYPEKIVSRATGTSDVSTRIGYEDVFRSTLKSFIDLWTDLKETVGFACLPQVTDILLYNSTAYAVCKYKDCITLESYFKDKSPLPPKKALSAFKNILMALKKLHSIGIIHGGISPKNVFVGADGKIHLGRFAIKQCHSINTALRAKPVSGFAPTELYGEEPDAGPHSDIYSFTALLYYSITGIIPSESIKRAIRDDMVLPSDIADKLSKNEISAIIKGLAVKPENRFSDIGEFMASLYAPKATQPQVPSQKKAAPRTAPKPAPRAVPKTPAKAVAKPTKPAVPKAAPKKAPKEKKAPEFNIPKLPKRDKKASTSNSIAPLMIKTFSGVIVGCFVIFSLLYTTVLYKSIEMPVMDKLFSGLSFLPMNKESEDVGTDIDNIPVTQSPSDYERTYVTVPNFKVHTYDRIKTNEVFNRNFVIEYKFQPSRDYEKNAVISQSLTAGESVLSGTKVTIVISEGVAQIELVDVIGMPYQQAKEKLELAGFTVKQDLRKNDGTQKAGEVFLMSKVAGLEFDEGTEIILTVWDEVEETTEEESTTKNNESTTKKKQNNSNENN